MTSSLCDRGRIFDYPQFASRCGDRVASGRLSWQAAGGDNDRDIAKSHIRKEAVGRRVLKRQWRTPWLVTVISAMEACVPNDVA